MSLDLVPKTWSRSWIVAGLLSIVGTGIATELTVIHARVHADPATRSFCTINEYVSCDKTAQSAFSMFAGVPLSVWGLLAYIALFVLALLGWRTRKAWVLGIATLMTSFCALTAILLVGVSLAQANLCVLCLASWFVDWSLFFVVARMARRVGFTQLLAELRHLWQARKVWLLLASVGAVGMWISIRELTPDAWATSGGHATRKAGALSPAAGATPEAMLPHGVDDAGHPYVGAAKPKLTITEFADYQCPHCAVAHMEMRRLLERHPQEIRLVHRHFPLDQQCNPLVTRPFHPHACLYAKMAACAEQAGKFWSANDWLFEHGRDETPVTSTLLAKQLGIDPAQLAQCIEQAGAAMVKGDVEEGMRLNIQGTPAFVVDGKVYPGRLPDEIIGPYE